MDILSLLLGVRDEAGEGFTDKEVRDQVMTLMFAGHDTSTSTLTFMMHELARHPDVLERLQQEQDEVLGGDTPDIERLEREMPYLDMVLDEVLRLYPPAWIGPRRAVRDFEFNGHRVSRGAYVNYCSWASHRIPEFFPEPEAFIPERFTRERKAALPRGAYVPFGGGRRICIGKRFGQIEVKLVATMLLQRLRLDAMPGRTMTVRQMPTLSPRGGLKMRVLPRRSRVTGCRRLGADRAPMRALVISDTHFGAWTGRDLLAEELYLERLAPQLEGIDELIFLGDLYDFLFGSVGDAVDASDGLLRLIAEKLPGKRLVFLAGNHDHHLVHRDAEDRLEAELASGRAGRTAGDDGARPALLPGVPGAPPARGRGRDRLPDLQLRRRPLHPRPLPRSACAALRLARRPAADPDALGHRHRRARAAEVRSRTTSR